MNTFYVFKIIKEIFAYIDKKVYLCRIIKNIKNESYNLCPCELNYR